jgi:hypothetical protein
MLGFGKSGRRSRSCYRSAAPSGWADDLGGDNRVIIHYHSVCCDSVNVNKVVTGSVIWRASTSWCRQQVVVDQRVSLIDLRASAPFDQLRRMADITTAISDGLGLLFERDTLVFATSPCSVFGGGFYSEVKTYNCGNHGNHDRQN